MEGGRRMEIGEMPEGVGSGEDGMNLHHYPLNLYKNWIIEFIKGIESQEWNELL